VIASHLFAVALLCRPADRPFPGDRLENGCVAAWSRSTDVRALVLFVLFIGVITGFPTHTGDQDTPYNSTPMLTYKAMFSTFAFTVMIAYGAMIAHGYFSTVRRWRYCSRASGLTVLVSAFTRPAAINAGLAAVG